MKFYKNLSIRYKLVMGVLPFLLVALINAGIQIKDNYSLFKDFTTINEGIHLSVNLSHLVHELQKERGRSSGYLSSDGIAFKQELRQQRRKTDEVYQDYKFYLDNIALSGFSDVFQNSVKELSLLLENYPIIRGEVDDFTISQKVAVQAYSDINAKSLHLIDILKDETNNTQLKQQLMAYVSFLKYKEKFGIERAVMSSIFLSGLDESNYNWEKELLQDQTIYLDFFQVLAQEEYLDKYNELFNAPAISEVADMRALVISKPFEVGDIDPNYWFDISTVQIEILKKMEDYLSDKILVDNLASVKRFWIILALGSLFVLGALLIVYLSIRSLLKDIEQLKDFAHKVSDGDLDQKIDLNSKDEIGVFANILSRMVGDVKHARNQILADKHEVEYLQNQANVVFENVNQGIFLIGKEHKISDLYSTEVEKIFDTETIAGQEFVQFMRPLLVSRDLESVEMFIRHLFNQEVDADTLKQLNPLEQVKLFFPDQTGMMQTKYVKMDFVRIMDGDEIHNVMVTAMDETEGVLLHRELEEAEFRSKEEMEQLLSILKIEPNALHQFLNNTMTELEQISDKYETSDKADFSSLLTYTYNVVHNLKGNATLIDLELMTKRLHEIEDLIVGLRQKREVSNESFLEILFKINSINRIIKNMKDLTDKVKNVSDQMQSQVVTPVSNDAFVIGLEKGVTKLSNEMGKPVNFHIEIEKGLQLAEKYKVPIKDIIIQLVRNSLVHGIEAKEERIKRGKPEKARIIAKINTTTDGKYKLEYYDDGRGLDIKKIIRKARSNNLSINVKNDTLSLEEVTKVLFADGFSTADEVTTHAGRGQGMSVIKSIVQTYHGRMGMTYSEGKYFAMKFLLPIESQPKSKVA